MGSTVGIGYANTRRVALGANLDVRSLSTGKPKRIKVTNLTNQYKAEWNDSMADDEAISITDGGVLTVVTSNGFSQLDGDSTNPPGFRLKALANVNDTTTEILMIETWG